MKKFLLIPLMLLTVMSMAACGGSDDDPVIAQETENMVRLSKITVDRERLAEYNAYLKEEIEASMRLEPGVLLLYAMAEKDHPNEVTILEIYADETAYKSHIETPHFQKYKQGTLDMVKHLELIDTIPLIPGLKMKSPSTAVNTVRPRPF